MAETQPETLDELAELARRITTDVLTTVLVTQDDGLAELMTVLELINVGIVGYVCTTPSHDGTAEYITNILRNGTIRGVRELLELVAAKEKGVN